MSGTFLPARKGTEVNRARTARPKVVSASTPMRMPRADAPSNMTNRAHATTEQRPSPDTIAA
jgi:hypothetical protein